MDIGTPLGLAFASGINAYLPLLAFATSARFLHLYRDCAGDADHS